VRPQYVEAARAIGSLLARSGHGVVFGGGDRGLMGSLAQAALEGGGEVIGVIPEGLAGDVRHPSTLDLRVVLGMHARKQLMYDLAGAFLVLPGGLGTLDEVFETLTWAQLGLHGKPIVFLDVLGYFEPLKALVDRAVCEGFVEPERRAALRFCADPAEALGALQA
jgi:uncharacterized protein (TIGR00730 family)